MGENHYGQSGVPAASRLLPAAFLGAWMASIGAGTAPAADVVLDNGGPGTTAEGTWVVGVGTTCYGKNYVYARSVGRYTFVPRISPGRYRVHLWWLLKRDDATAVPVTVQTHQGPVAVTVNQSLNGGKWNLLGTYDLDPAAKVVIKVVGGKPVIADAVRFEPVPPLDPPPSAPTGLQGSPSGDSIVLDWNDGPESDLAGYSVYRRAAPGGGYELLAREIPGSSYTDTWLVGGATYYYVITATDLGGGLSLPSVEVAATSSAVPTVVVDNGSPGTVAVGNWSKFLGKSCYGPSSYYRQFNGSYTFKPQLSSGNYRVFLWWTVDFKLSTDVPVTIQTAAGPVVRTVDQSRDGGKWNLLDIVGLDSGASVRLDVTSAKYVCADAVRFEFLSAVADPPPSAPAGLTASGGYGVVQLNWGDNPEGDLASYSVYRSTAPGGGYAPLASGLSASAYDDRAVSSGTTYYYIAFAVDGGGHISSASAEVSAKARNAIDLAWSPPTQNQDGTPLADLTGYKVYRGTSPGVYGAVVDAGAATQYSTGALSPGTYYFRVTAHDASGNESQFSNEISQQMP